MHSGVYPVVPTTFDDRGEIDLDSQKRAVDFMIDANVNGLCILANWSEQFAITDDERERLMTLIIDHVAGRVPVVVGTSHFSSKVAAERSRQAQAAGAQMVMLMPPYHGATIRVDETAMFGYFRAVADAIDIPIMVQDAPVSGVELSVGFLAKLAAEIEPVKYLKIEVPGTAAKLRELVRLVGDVIEGPFDGEEGITLIPDLDAGATGTMPSAVMPEIFRRIFDLHRGGQREEAIALFERYLPLVNYENKLGGLSAAKVLMKEGGVIRSEATRHPTPPLQPDIRTGLVETARRLNPLVLYWAK